MIGKDCRSGCRDGNHRPECPGVGVDEAVFRRLQEIVRGDEEELATLRQRVEELEREVEEARHVAATKDRKDLRPEVTCEHGRWRLICWICATVRQQEWIDRAEQAERQRDRLAEGVLDVCDRVLGPSAPDCVGCAVEVDEALKLLRALLAEIDLQMEPPNPKMETA